MDYILVMLAAVLLAFEFSFSKKYQSIEGTAIVSGLRYNMLTGLLSALIMFGINGFRFEFSGYSLIMALSMSLCSSLNVLLSFKVLKLGGMALYSTFLMSGGMLLPYIFGVLFLNESLTLFRIFGIMAVLAGVVFSTASLKQANTKQLILCFAVFILNGFVSILSKCHQITVSHATIGTASFAMYSGIGKFIFSAAALIFCKPQRSPMQKKHSVAFVAGAAIIGGISYLLQLVSARALPATVLYPIITGGSMIFSAIAGRVFVKEPLSKRQLFSIIFCLIGTLLFL